MMSNNLTFIAVFGILILCVAFLFGTLASWLRDDKKVQTECKHTPPPPASLPIKSYTFYGRVIKTKDHPPSTKRNNEFFI